MASPAACAQFFVDGQAPNMPVTAITVGDHALCGYKTFADMDSIVTLTPLWAAEHITKSYLESHHGIKRSRNPFHEEPSLPKSQEATLADYRHSGYDRGHMANWEDTEDVNSFTLGNVVPQNPTNNRHLWAWIESATRYLATEYGQVYVVTGPIFDKDPAKINNRVWVPTQLFKAVYVPALHQSGVYVTCNCKSKVWQDISVDQLATLTGINVFPSLPSSETNTALKLPSPHPYRQK